MRGWRGALSRFCCVSLVESASALEFINLPGMGLREAHVAAYAKAMSNER